MGATQETTVEQRRGNAVRSHISRAAARVLAAGLVRTRAEDIKGGCRENRFPDSFDLTGSLNMRRTQGGRRSGRGQGRWWGVAAGDCSPPPARVIISPRGSGRPPCSQPMPLHAPACCKPPAVQPAHVTARLCMLRAARGTLAPPAPPSAGPNVQRLPERPSACRYRPLRELCPCLGNRPLWGLKKNDGSEPGKDAIVCIA